MSQNIYVISDLHLGGKPGFQMCSPKGQALLSSFVLTNPGDLAHSGTLTVGPSINSPRSAESIPFWISAFSQAWSHEIADRTFVNRTISRWRLQQR